MNAQVLGISVDSVPCLKAWSDSLGEITYPLLSDFYPHGKVAQLYGVLRADGTSERAIFVIDTKGIVRYVDVHDIEDQPDNEVLFDALLKLNPTGSVVRTAEQPEPQPEPTADNVMYCTSWCPECRRARVFFKEKGIDLVEVDISRDREAAKRVRGWANGNETTPTFNIRGTVIVGFDRAKVSEALGIKA